MRLAFPLNLLPPRREHPVWQKALFPKFPTQQAQTGMQPYNQVRQLTRVFLKGRSHTSQILKTPSSASEHVPRSRTNSVSPYRSNKVSTRSTSPGSVFEEDFENVFDDVVEEKVN